MRRSAKKVSLASSASPQPWKAKDIAAFRRGAKQASHVPVLASQEGFVQSADAAEQLLLQIAHGSPQLATNLDVICHAQILCFGVVSLTSLQGPCSNR